MFHPASLSGSGSVVVVILATVLWFATGRKNFMTNAEAEHLTIDASKLLD